MDVATELPDGTIEVNGVYSAVQHDQALTRQEIWETADSWVTKYNKTLLGVDVTSGVVRL
jgi:hypothetical protein